MKENTMRVHWRSLSALVTVLALGLSAPALASGDSGHTLSIDEAVSQIRDDLNLSSQQPIDPDAVPAPLLEQLGDAVMAEMAGSEAHHQWMDTMMGGEGSESLASAHRWMGYRYLTGGYGPYGPGRGMHGGMHGGMRGPGMMGRWGMMGNPRWGNAPDAYDSPEEIARRRYARGEITREEFREIMEELER
jgi:hypothetical protein